MRTTISVDDHLLDRAKRKARERGQTLGQYVEDAIRRDVNGPAERKEAPEIPVFHGAGGLNPRIDPTSNSSYFEVLDEGVPLEKLR